MTLPLVFLQQVVIHTPCEDAQMYMEDVHGNYATVFTQLTVGDKSQGRSRAQT